MTEIKNRHTDETIASGDKPLRALASENKANLEGAYLEGAYLKGADLREAYLNWDSHDLLAEILKQAAGKSIEKQKIAGFILIMLEGFPLHLRPSHRLGTRRTQQIRARQRQFPSPPQRKKGKK